ncbi:hypothetical protein [Plantactinospora soyae]|uniref:Tetratricopeptide (TPR) repeat protein n=1 Tax=Plantactinospora soyae TaxID=1544732 RepID=A0A927QY46_9ACTN|nr:hypothetical protein [Plantactinospora soyae]MBE1486163.1 tetratricopeptide (TPR) repeat protein [Plantactinospora soyae]
MENVNRDLWRALHRITEMPYGAGQIAAVEQLIRQADADGDDEIAFVARVVGTDSYVFGGEPGRSFVTFSWCLAEFDGPSKPYHQRNEYNLLRQFKYMINSLLNFPDVPLDRTYAVLDDMERRYRDGGHSLQAVYKRRHRVARHVGAPDEAEEWYRRWLTAPRNQLSDCAGCDPTSQIDYLASSGRHEEAVALAEPVLTGRLGCAKQPQAVLTALLRPYLHSGRRAEARDAHLRAYRRHRSNVADLRDIGEHLTFCALTGNEPRGLELLERHLDWLDRAPSPGAAMEFAVGAALLLRRLDSAGHGTLTVHRSAYGERSATEVPVTVLAEELTTTAHALAARFDARNGTSTKSNWVGEHLALEPIGPYLPLSATAARQDVGPVGSTGTSGTSAGVDPPPPPPPAETPPPTAPPTPPPTAPPTATRTATRTDPGATSPDLAADVPPIRLLELIEERWLRHRQDDHLATALRTFDERFADVSLDASVLARRAELRALQRHTVDDVTGGVTANREAIALHRQVPDPVREQIVAGRLGVLLALADDPAEGLSLAQGSADYLAEHGDGVARAGGYDRLSIVLFNQERTTEALEAVDRAAAEAAGVGDRYLLARIALRRTRFLDLLGRRVEANEAVRQARDLLLDLGGPPDYLATACLRYADSVEEPAEAVPAWDEAVRTATDETVVQARSLRARALLLVDRPAEAVDDLVEAVALSVRWGIADGAAHLRWKLAEAYQRAGMLTEAAEAAEEAIGELKRLGRQADADCCRHLLAAVYAALHEYDLAVALLDELAANLDSPDNLVWRGRVLEEAGDLLYRQDRDSLAAQRFAAAATAYRLAERGIDELRTWRREVSAQIWARDPDAALAALGRADRVAATLDPPDVASPTPTADPAVSLGEPAEDAVSAAATLRWERALLAEAAARALLAVGRPEEALGRLPGVADELRSLEALGEAQHVDLLTGELLVRSDRPAEAEPLLRTTLGVVTERPDLASRGALWLAEALTALGRYEEATALRAEYALDPDQ